MIQKCMSCSQNNTTLTFSSSDTSHRDLVLSSRLAFFVKWDEHMHLLSRLPGGLNGLINVKHLAQFPEHSTALNAH